MFRGADGMWGALGKGHGGVGRMWGALGKNERVVCGMGGLLDKVGGALAKMVCHGKGWGILGAWGGVLGAGWGV